MNSREPFDLAKMAIITLLVILALGATVAFFYTLYDATDNRIDSMQKATLSASMDRLYDLRDLTETNIGKMDKYPLVTNIVSALSDFNNEDLLYISVTTPQTEDNKTTVYTYSGTTLTGIATTDIVYSSVPVTDACKTLLRYSDCTAAVYIGEAEVNGYPGLSFVQIDIYDALGGEH